ncbi:MAG: prephenate dehydrogenase/arogenate dehydrogenase family protein, partial [Bacteroidota bacterium]
MTVALIGTGLIGASLAQAWRSRRPDVHIVGFDRPEPLEVAVQRGAIHQAAQSAAQAVEAAEVVVLATPIGAMPAILDEIAPHLNAGATVTDVGSVKAGVVAYARRVLPETVRVVGGHPMAGTADSGPAHADPLLFENATYVLCPANPEELDPETFEAAHPRLLDLVRATGARTLILDAERHDRAAAGVSHVPQLVAVALVEEAIAQDDPALLRLAAGGFRDMTRIASSRFSMWQSILAANKGAVVETLRRLEERLARYRAGIDAGELSELAAEFESAGETRRSIPRDMKGFLRPLADVYVYAEDRPGYLARLTGILF